MKKKIVAFGMAVILVLITFAIAMPTTTSEDGADEARGPVNVMMQYGGWWTTTLEYWLDALPDMTCVRNRYSDINTLRNYDCVIVYGNQYSYAYTDRHGHAAG